MRVTMFRWGKRNQGFVWHEYVRTTIALRREARREAVERLKQQAADGARAAKGAASAAKGAANAAAREGARNLGAGSRIVAARGAAGLGAGLRYAWIGLGAGLRYAWIGLGAGLHYAWIGLGAGLRHIRIGLGASTRMAAKATKKAAQQSAGWFASLPRRTQLAIVGVAAGLLAVGAGTAWFVPGAASGLLARMPSLPSIPFLSRTQTITGRAVVTAPGVIKVGDVTVQLADLEAPDREQSCLRGGRRWRCGDASIAALQRLTVGRSLACDVRAPGADRTTSGRCRDGQSDIGAALVKGGNAFATGSYAPAYAAEEATAKAAKAGLWSGEAERPDVWRARVWEEAKKSRPDGCAIKGVVAGGSKLYVLPWSGDYDRARVDQRRGGRWFCTEQEAKDAGWRPG